MIRRLAWGLLALLVFATALLAFFPAALAVRWIAPPLPDLVLDDVRGTIWNGRVDRVAHQGEELGQLRWVARPAALAQGRYEADVVLEGGRATGRAQLVRSLRELHLEAVSAQAAAELFDGALGPGLRPQGRLDVSLAHARWRDDALVAIDGRADWRGAAVSGLMSARLGEIGAVFVDDGAGRVRGQVEAREGALDVDGGFVTGPAGWEVDLLLASRDAAVARLLQWFGQPDDSGRRRLRLEGAWATATS